MNIHYPPHAMRIALTSVFVDDQSKALDFYTEKLGFTLEKDMPARDYRWLTVSSPESANGVELLLEPNQHPAAQAYQRAIREDNIPATSFLSSDVRAEYEKLVDKGVRFTMEPTDIGPTVIAVFDDTCGNLIQIAQG
jgi:catechol 2,3-dioxygenase-like lactoylglutathione lyase family enzyme